MPSLGVTTDDQEQFQIRQAREQIGPPYFPALPSWRQVTAVGAQSGKTESHWNNGNLGCIIKIIVAYLHPLPQSNPGRITEWPSAFMYPGSGRLAGDTDGSRLRNLNDGPWFMIHRLAIARRITTHPTGSDCAQVVFKCNIAVAVVRIIHGKRALSRRYSGKYRHRMRNGMPDLARALNRLP